MKAFRQDHEKWCWAASLQSMFDAASYPAKSQQEMVDLARSHLASDEGFGFPWSLEKVLLAIHGITISPRFEQWDPNNTNKLQTLLNAGQHVLLFLEKAPPDCGGHVVAVAKALPPNGLQVMDPATGQFDDWDAGKLAQFAGICLWHFKLPRSGCKRQKSE